LTIVTLPPSGLTLLGAPRKNVLNRSPTLYKLTLFVQFTLPRGKIPAHANVSNY
jgi:hypothetical protein